MILVKIFGKMWFKKKKKISKNFDFGQIFEKKIDFRQNFRNNFAFSKKCRNFPILAKFSKTFDFRQIFELFRLR